MPLSIPNLDDRKYQDLLDEALARIPVHTPEWTNFNKSDPGVTLIEIFAFLTETLLYRANQIPERNRLKFLSLLGVPLQPASSARGLVTISNERGPLQTITLNGGMEVRAGQVPFRTDQGLDVLPIEGRVYFKRKLMNPADEVRAYYDQLYASFTGQPAGAELQLYETVLLDGQKNGVDLGGDTIDGSIWIALLARPGDTPAAVRGQIAKKTLSLGVVPALTDAARWLVPGGRANPEGEAQLAYRIPKIPADGKLPGGQAKPSPDYQLLDAIAPTDVLAEPGVVQITLPGVEALKLWSNLDPIEQGVGDLPPALEDTELNDRIITWLRISSSAKTTVQAKLLWVGINTVMVSQKAHISSERLPRGTGEPDQVVTLSKKPVIPGSVRLLVTPPTGASGVWEEIDDLMGADPEVQVPDLRLPPGASAAKRSTDRKPRIKVFGLDPESGEVRCGDGLRGARFPLGAQLTADYDYSEGKAGNVNEGSINTAPALPAGMKVTNPVPTWGGADKETVRDGEKQISRYLQHRDRLVNAADFDTIVRRTPGVDIGRVDVIPAFNPELVQNEPGDAPGVVTLMIIPKYDPVQPDAPLPDRLFLNTICSYLEPRRLVTTELFLRGPVYKDIWLSAGINVVAGRSIAEVREAVKQALLAFLSPLPSAQTSEAGGQAVSLTAPQPDGSGTGWPLRNPVVALQLLAVASRVSGVSLVSKVLLAEDTGDAKDQVEMKGLELPRVMGISVAVGDPVEIDHLRGTTAQAPPGPADFVPVPVIPEGCR